MLHQLIQSVCDQLVTISPVDTLDSFITSVCGAIIQVLTTLGL